MFLHDPFFTMTYPLLNILSCPPPKADVLPSNLYRVMVSVGFPCNFGQFDLRLNSLFLTEHGIYTREREERLLRCQVGFTYCANRWVRLFYICWQWYGICQNAEKITNLFTKAKEIQDWDGLASEKCRVISKPGLTTIRFLKFLGARRTRWLGCIGLDRGSSWLQWDIKTIFVILSYKLAQQKFMAYVLEVCISSLA